VGGGVRATIVAAALLVACGPAVDREATLDRLRAAAAVEVDSAEEVAELNALALQVSEGRLLDGLYRDQVEAAIGRGRRCGPDPLCSRQGFANDDLIYFIGQRGGVPAGPRLLVGFDGTGRCDATFVYREERELFGAPR
jgi:hypothetical protein